MEYEKVKQWLDDVVDMAEHSKSLEEFNTSICTTDLIRNIQLYNGIDIVSDVMNIKLTAEPRKYDDESEYIRSSFVYRSVEFSQLNEVKDGIVCQKQEGISVHKIEVEIKEDCSANVKRPNGSFKCNALMVERCNWKGKKSCPFYKPKDGK